MGTILVATDGSASAASAVASAVDLAAAEGAELVVLAVWRRPTATFTPRNEFEPELELVERELGRRAVDAALELARAADVPARGVVIEGDASQEICALADNLGAELIVIGSHGSGDLVEAMLGSVSHTVLRQATVPVLVVPVRKEAPRAEEIRGR